MQVTESMLLSQLTTDVNTSSANFQNLQQELATGMSINQPSDDPSGASQDMTIRGVLVNIAQYQTNANNANSVMQYTSSQLQSVDNLINQARTIAVAAANGGTADSTTEQDNVTQIQAIISQLTSLANSTYNGQYIFSGQQTSQEAYTPGDTTYTYQGDDNPINVSVGNSTSVQTNIPGDQIFSPLFTALTQLQTDITANDSSAISTTDLSALDTGLNTVESAQSTMGVRMDSLQNTISMLGTTQLNYQTSLSNIEDADIATVYVQMQSAQDTYQAALVATQKAMQYSLADYLN